MQISIIIEGGTIYKKISSNQILQSLNSQTV